MKMKVLGLVLGFAATASVVSAANREGDFSFSPVIVPLILIWLSPPGFNNFHPASVSSIHPKTLIY